jgi:hypothetical protein
MAVSCKARPTASHAERSTTVKWRVSTQEVTFTASVVADAHQP